MAPQDHIKKALEEHRQLKLLLETGDMEKASASIDWQENPCEFESWLQNQGALSLADKQENYLRLVALHEQYHEALERAIILYQQNAHEQAKACVEGEFKEKSLKLTAEMLRCIALCHKEELHRYETI